MHKIFYTLFFVLILSFQGLEAQTKVEKHTDVGGKKSPGVVYSLPQTKVRLHLLVEKKVSTPGIYARFSRQHLGLEAISVARTAYELRGVQLEAYGVPDKNKVYHIQFKEGSTAPFVMLTEDGLLCAINTEYTPNKAEPFAEQIRKEEEQKVFRKEPAFSPEYLQATSPQKRAEIAAREIHSLREARTSIVSGEAEQSFPDGQAMKLALDNISTQERALAELFTGYTTSTLERITVDNLSVDSVSNSVAFRFSVMEGVLDKDDLSGEPVYMQVKIEDEAPVLTPKEAEKAEKALKGIVYNRPGRVEITLKRNGKTLLQEKVYIAQLGTKEALAPALFNNKKNAPAVIRLTFFPATGALERIYEQ
ncbi:MAG: DUF4831 family protein [Porphyromonas sp.]|nr:DUF4831 family protein [Porphyromonas sp.]